MAKKDKNAEKAGHYVLNGDLEKLHKKNRKLKKTEGGSCLTGHEGSMCSKKTTTKKDASGKETKTVKISKPGGSTCNYRFQSMHRLRSGHKTAETKKLLQSYKLKAAAVATSALVETDGSGSPVTVNGVVQLSTPNSAYGTNINLPTKKGDWDIDGPNRKDYVNVTGLDPIPQGFNFCAETWPYWNNAHHIIPKGTLKAVIMGSDQFELIQGALMDGKYNINHHVNMLLMPQDLEVAKYIGVLRHLQLNHDDGYMTSPAVTNHPKYNRKAESQLNKIIKGYEKIALEAVKKAEDAKHDVPDVEVDKAKLEALSDELFQWIVDLSARFAGESLDSRANAEDSKKRKATDAIDPTPTKKPKNATTRTFAKPKKPGKKGGGS